jgi:hypothetical protein
MEEKGSDDTIPKTMKAIGLKKATKVAFFLRKNVSQEFIYILDIGGRFED